MTSSPWKPSPKIKISRRDLLKAGAAGLAASAGLKLTPALAQGGRPLGFCPNKGIVGDIITLKGPNLGSMPNDVLVKITDDTNVAFLRGLSFFEGELLAEIRAVPPGFTRGKAEVTLGMGTLSNPANMPNELALAYPIFSWLGNGGDRYRSFQPFKFEGNVVQSCNRFWGGIDLGAVSVEISVPFDDDCCPIVKAGTTLVLRACGATNGDVFEFGYEAALVTQTDLLIDQVASAICTILVSTFNSEYGVSLNCSYTVIADNRVVLTIESPNFDAFTSGAVQVELLAGSHLGSQSMSMYDDSMSMASMSFDCDSFDQDCQSMPSDCSSMSINFVPFLFN